MPSPVSGLGNSIAIWAVAAFLLTYCYRWPAAHQRIKHRYQLDRTRLDGLTGARIWCGYGVLVHNLTNITALAASKALKPRPSNHFHATTTPPRPGPAGRELTSSGRSN